MYSLASKVPNRGAVLKRNRPVHRLAAIVLFSLIATAASEDRPGAQAAATATWTAADVGSPSIRGTAKSSACSVATGCPFFIISAAGTGIGGASDQFTFLYQRLIGDGAIVLRVGVGMGAAAGEAGLMFRESLNANSKHASVMAGTSINLRRRTTTGGPGAETVQARPSGEIWMRLERAGDVVTASTSTDGSQWSVAGTQTVAMAATIYAGIAVTSRTPRSTTIALVSSMSVATTTPTLPSGWSSSDIGPAPSLGTAFYGDSTFAGVSFAAGVRAEADAFRFVYYRTRGDLRLVARVATAQGGAGRQAGIMLRDSLDPGSIQETLLLDDTGIALVKRTALGIGATTTRVASRVPPVWLRLERSGQMVTSSYSTDGTKWLAIATDTLPLAADLHVGLAVSAGPSLSRAAAGFDQVSLISVAANRPPAVSLVAPSTGAAYRQGKPVTLTAAATDPDDRVARVEFKVNGTLVGTDTTAPYSATWSAGANGLYALTAVAVDDDGASTTSEPIEVSVTANRPPAVSLMAPATGTGKIYRPGDPVTITAAATDPDDRVVRVDFKVNGTLLGTDTTAPYSATWAAGAASPYTITAVAVDDDGASTTSEPIVVSVAANRPPVVSLAAPVTGTTYRPGDPVTFTASATDPDNRVVRVDFKVNGTLLGTDTTAPYSATWAAGAANPYTVTAVAVDDDGASTTSEPIVLSVAANRPPVVSLLAPVTGTIYRPGDPVTIAASATDPDDRVVRVDFKVNGTPLGSDTTAPYTATWPAGAANLYAFTAVAVDGDGASTTSLPVVVSVLSVAPTRPPFIVSLASPLEFTLFQQGEPVSIAAMFTGPADRIARVEFRANGNLVGSATAAPYSVMWSAGVKGLYEITAVAVEDDGASTASEPIQVFALPRPRSSTRDDEEDPDDPGPLPAPGRWNLVFKASFDHATLDYYVLDIYKAHTPARRLSRNLGRPDLVRHGFVALDVDSDVESLPPGDYEVIVTAVAGARRNRSASFYMTR